MRPFWLDTSAGRILLLSDTEVCMHRTTHPSNHGMDAHVEELTARIRSIVAGVEVEGQEGNN